MYKVDQKKRLRHIFIIWFKLNKIWNTEKVSLNTLILEASTCLLIFLVNVMFAKMDTFCVWYNSEKHFLNVFFFVDSE